MDKVLNLDEQNSTIFSIHDCSDNSTTSLKLWKRTVENMLKYENINTFAVQEILVLHTEKAITSSSIQALKPNIKLSKSVAQVVAQNWPTIWVEKYTTLDVVRQYFGVTLKSGVYSIAVKVMKKVCVGKDNPRYIKSEKIRLTNNNGDFVNEWVKVANEKFHQMFLLSVSDILDNTHLLGPFETQLPSVMDACDQNSLQLIYYFATIIYGSMNDNDDHTPTPEEPKRNYIMVSRGAVCGLMIESHESNVQRIHKKKTCNTLETNKKIIAENGIILFEGELDLDTTDNDNYNHWQSFEVPPIIILTEGSHLIYAAHDRKGSCRLSLKTEHFVLKDSRIEVGFDLNKCSQQNINYICDNLVSMTYSLDCRSTIQDSAIFKKN